MYETAISDTRARVRPIDRRRLVESTPVDHIPVDQKTPPASAVVTNTATNAATTVATNPDVISASFSDQIRAQGPQSGSTTSGSSASSPAKSTAMPADKPGRPHFSSGPCAKPPGWSVDQLDTQWLGRSHRAAGAKADIKRAIERCRRLMDLPDDWLLAIVPGSDTGAFEMAMWSLLGSRPVDALVWESFSADWASDLTLLNLPDLHVHKSDYGHLPQLDAVNPAHDLVFVANGTTSGVKLPDFDFIDAEREGLVLCDATSAVFAMPLDYEKLDVVTWSWQKVLGGEAAHGMLAISPRTVERLTQPAPRPLPKIFRLAKDGKLIKGIFEGATINTPSMLAIADLHVALDWAESVGGLTGLQQRSQRNFEVIDEWVQACDWIDWLAPVAEQRSTTSLCLAITADLFQALDEDSQKAALKFMLGLLDTHTIAFDIANYRSAPTGLRIWGGATVNDDDLRVLTQWLDWAWQQWLAQQGADKNQNMLQQETNT